LKGRRIALVSVALAGALVGMAPALAHDLGTIYSRWTLTGTSATVTVDLPWAAVVALDPARLATLAPESLGEDRGAAAMIDVALLDGFGLRVGDRGCEPDTPPVGVPAAPGRLARRWTLACPIGGQIAIVTALGGSNLGLLLHLARLELDLGATEGGAVTYEHAFPSGEEVWVLPDSAPRNVEDAAGATTWSSDGSSPSGLPRGLTSFVGLGMRHFLGGVDYLLFLAGLLLLAGGGIGEIFRAVIAFAVAQSLALATGVLGIIEPQQDAIRALIGLSIVVVALAYFHLDVGRSTRRWIDLTLVIAISILAFAPTGARATVPSGALLGLGVLGLAHLELAAASPSPARWQWTVAFAFGMVYGFGFAGSLLELRLPRGSIAGAVLGFNLGIECAQLVVVALLLGCAALVRSWLPGARARLLADLAATAVLGFGWYWLLVRTFD